ncbi:zeta toxin family protein [Prosthecobacter fluviatilis]|uniref:Zeta toxin family protein n=1 Tax=Prosthecobacter fluviatilis TaxID=445931 RepID=A0ABW0KWX0_9BACT
MSLATPRLRMFAGPNGSGKSVLKSYLPKPLLGVYLNPDDIEKAVRDSGYVDMHSFGIETTAAEVLAVFTHSEFLIHQDLAAAAGSLSFVDGRLYFPPRIINSYFASVVADFLRHQLMAARRTFTFETVMSHPGKVELLQKAQKAGYRTYLYYVATDDPAINISRVENRVKLNGMMWPLTASRSATIARWICFSPPFASPTGPISLTTPRTMPTTITPGWQRSPRVGDWN